MAELKKGTSVVVTDSEKALFLRNLTDHEDPNLNVFDEEEQENRRPSCCPSSSAS